MQQPYTLSCNRLTHFLVTALHTSLTKTIVTVLHTFLQPPYTLSCNRLTHTIVTALHTSLTHTFVTALHTSFTNTLTALHTFLFQLYTTILLYTSFTPRPTGTNTWIHCVCVGGGLIMVVCTTTTTTTPFSAGIFYTHNTHTPLIQNQSIRTPSPIKLWFFDARPSASFRCGGQ